MDKTLDILGSWHVDAKVPNTYDWFFVHKNERNLSHYVKMRRISEANKSLHSYGLAIKTEDTTYISKSFSLIYPSYKGAVMLLK